MSLPLSRRQSQAQNAPINIDGPLARWEPYNSPSGSQSDRAWKRYRPLRVRVHRGFPARTAADLRSLLVLRLSAGPLLSSLALASMGWDVIATDLPDVVSSVLSHNIARNLPQLPPDSGTVQVRVFDWTVPPDHWVWDDPRAISSPQPEKPLTGVQQGNLLGPPFDLVITSDTIYSAELVMPLLRALRGICDTSLAISPESRSPPVYICLERRDPALVDSAISQAKDAYNFKVERIPYKRLAKAMGKAGAHWAKADWEGVEIWKLSLRS